MEEVKKQVESGKMSGEQALARLKELGADEKMLEALRKSGEEGMS